MIGASTCVIINILCRFDECRKGTGTPLNLAGISYGDSATWDACLEACANDYRCGQVVFDGYSQPLEFSLKNNGKVIDWLGAIYVILYHHF